MEFPLQAQRGCVGGLRPRGLGMSQAFRLDREHVVVRWQRRRDLVNPTLHARKLRHQPGKDRQQKQHRRWLHMQDAQREEDDRAQSDQRAHLEPECRCRLMFRVLYGVCRDLIAQLAEELHIAIFVVVGLHALRIQQVFFGGCIDLANALVQVLAARPHPFQRASLQQHQATAQSQHQQCHRSGELQRHQQDTAASGSPC